MSAASPWGSVDYSSAETPPSYACTTCGKTGIKLWRSFQIVAAVGTLMCADDAAQDQGVDISSMGEDGWYAGKYGTTNQISWYVPAIPRESHVFWGTSSAPLDTRTWWAGLPVR